MHFKIYDGFALEKIKKQDLPLFCRTGVFVCCNSGGGHEEGDDGGSGCGMHLWKWVGPDPLPAWHVLFQAAKKDVPHCNGQGVHAS